MVCRVAGRCAIGQSVNREKLAREEAFTKMVRPGIGDGKGGGMRPKLAVDGAAWL